MPAAAYLLLAFAAALAAARQEEKTEVTVVVVLAAEEGAAIDPKLKTIAEEVQKVYPNLKSFRIKEMMAQSLTVDEKATFALTEDKAAYLTVKQAADKDQWITLSVVAPKLGEIVYRTVAGKFLPIVTRYQTNSGERLILAIRAQPSPK